MDSESGPRHATFIVAIACLIAAAVAALPLDGPVSAWVRAGRIDVALKGDWRGLAALLKVPGEYWCAVLAAAVLSVRRIRPSEIAGLFGAFIFCAALIALFKSFVDDQVDLTAKLILNLPGTLMIVAIAVAIVLTREPALWTRGAFVVLCALASSLNGVVKWMVGRYRPFKAPPYLDQLAPFYCEPFRGGIRGLFKQTNLAFPSGHGCLAFALATGLAILLPKFGRWFYLAAALTAAERFAENAHHLSDSIASAALGVGAAWAVWTIAGNVQRREVWPQMNTDAHR